LSNKHQQWSLNMDRRNFHIRDYRDLDPEEEIADGTGLRVPLTLADGGESRTRVTDALAAHNRGAGHRPGYLRDAITYGRSELRDASDDLLDRRGVTLDEATALRDQAFSDLCKRSESAWKGKHLASDNSDPDNNNSEPPEPGDEDALAEAMRQRDLAWEQMRIRGDNAWRGRTDPNAANAIQNQAARWRRGK
jgi:hypothetical protein